MNATHRRVLIGGLLSLLAACELQERQATVGAEQTLWLLGQTPDLDAVHASDTEATLALRYGRSVVVRGRVDLGEGQTEPGTIIFPHDATRRVQIRWADTIGYARPVLAVVNDSASRWQVHPGVGLHTSLRELERLNARPFVLTGMEWDYSGTVVSWEHGTLDDIWPSSASGTPLVRLRLSRPGNDGLTAAVRGDRHFRSDHPSMSALDPRVYEMAVVPR